AQWDIKQAEEKGTHAIFEPEFVTAAEFEDNSQRNTPQESLNRLGEADYDEQNWNYNFGIEGLVPTGAKLNLDYELSQLSNSVTDSLTNKDDEYQMYLGLSLRQPLLKNAGIGTTKTAIRVAQRESQASFQEYRQEMMHTISKAAKVYWDFYRAQENLTLIKESVRIADKVLIDNRQRHRTGKMAKTEVLEAMAGVASRRVLASEAQHEHREAANRLNKVLSVTPSQENPRIEVIDKPVVDKLDFDGKAVLQKAFELRPEYLEARERLEKANIKLAFAKNQRWPELDLVASYGHNGLDFSSSGSWDQIEKADFKSWAVGVEFRVPIGGGIKSRSELTKAKLEIKSQLLALKDIEVIVTNNIDTAMHHISSAEEQRQHADGNVGLRKRLLDSELARLDAGKSSTRLILEKEDDYRNAKEFALKNRVELQTALTELELAGGTILLKHGAEIMEIKP
ncbi:MAG: TolC family protein, partial [Deltaproteobacteria bacterium]|nr:TolC family protein [Deltaproteobacteria bacterium]